MFAALKKKIKQYRSSSNPFIRFCVSSLSYFRNAVVIAMRACVDSEYRSMILLQMFNDKNAHQTTPLTFLNRYPEIFSACRDYFNGSQDLKILSYGCSTGEEVITLREYFPSANIVGAEINKRSLAICKNRKVDDKISFIYSDPANIQRYAPFNAIFCMAVLQRNPHQMLAKGVDSLEVIYPFEKFENQIIELDRLVKPQGLLIVHFTQYSLLDTCVAHKYKALGNYNQDDYAFPVYDKNSRVIKNPASQNSIFIKLRN